MNTIAEFIKSIDEAEAKTGLRPQVVALDPYSALALAREIKKVPMQGRTTTIEIYQAIERGEVYLFGIRLIMEEDLFK